VLSKYHGESERYLRGVFERARTLPRAVIFFDGEAFEW
jgi:SpoVK/Ycf46/Vps4 family AAA+-type ATPase